MSRSRKRTPISGITRAESDKPFKVSEHRRERRAVRSMTGLLAGGTDAGMPAEMISEDDGFVIPSPKAFGNPWASEKDGKKYRPDDVRAFRESSAGRG